MNSILPKEAIEVIAQSIGITNLSPEVSQALGPDVEFRLREIMQESIKCMRHSRRTTLKAKDVDSALKLRNVEPIYGFASGDSLQFKRANGHKDLFYIDDKDVEFKDVMEAPIPKAPLDLSISSHWLAIEGVQPAISENAPEASTDGKKVETKEDGQLEVKLPVKYILSRELQLYFEKIKGITVNRSSSSLFKEALVSLSTDKGLHSSLPCFLGFISDEVAQNLSNFSRLFALMRVTRSLLQNPHIHMEPYLHQMMPPVITCILAKKLGNRISDNHWELRNFAATLAAEICLRFGHVYHDLPQRVTKTLLHTFLDPTKLLPQHYGAIQGLAALGPSVVRLLVLPNLEPYMQLLQPEMQLDKQKDDLKRHEAWRVYGALQRAVGRCMLEKLKKYRNLFTPPIHAALKSKAKIAIPTTSNKRKANTDNVMQQPTKRLATEGSVGNMQMQVEMKGAISGFPTAAGRLGMPHQLSSEQLARRDFVGQQGKSKSLVLAQAWKEDMDAGLLLSSVFEFFGDSVFSYTPKPELSLFL